MSKQQHIFIFLCAAVLWMSMAVLVGSALFEGLSIVTYLQNEIAANYRINDANLEIMSCEQNANTVCCLYKATDVDNNEHYVAVTFSRYTLYDQDKVYDMTLLPEYFDNAQYEEMAS